MDRYCNKPYTVKTFWWWATKVCSLKELCPQCTIRERNRKLSHRNYHLTKYWYAWTLNVKNYFKNKPIRFIAEDIAFYAKYDIELDMRNYYKNTFLPNTPSDEGHREWESGLRDKSITNEPDTPYKYPIPKKSYWNRLIFLILTNKVNINRSDLNSLNKYDLNTDIRNNLNHNEQDSMYDGWYYDMTEEYKEVIAKYDLLMGKSAISNTTIVFDYCLTMVDCINYVKSIFTSNMSLFSSSEYTYSEEEEW